ncbi:PREDICTED: uncharacterized protein C4orf26 homolog [Chinchilla lanigera]|uniref:Odontosis associated phosphoprotein n=1 Tax=Chinchilla lanigera TaxID=34839 RepID=A0A8C2USC6_CHILA|nr:PREDICTED: uncharacterized protein C4orf26 homolog [Chinchilla lanigera]
MALRLCCSRWALLCWLVAFVAQGAEGLALPPGGTQHNAHPTDCQIFPLTPPPATRSPVTRPRPRPGTRTPRQPLVFFPQWPRVPPRFPGPPFLPPDCSRRFPWQPGFWPRCCVTPRQCQLGTELRGESSSSEETGER